MVHDVPVGLLEVAPACVETAAHHIFRYVVPSLTYTVTDASHGDLGTGPAIIRTFFSESAYLVEGFGCLTSLVGEHFTLTPTLSLRELTGVGISQFVIPS